LVVINGADYVHCAVQAGSLIMLQVHISLESDKRDILRRFSKF